MDWLEKLESNNCEKLDFSDLNLWMQRARAIRRETIVSRKPIPQMVSRIQVGLTERKLISNADFMSKLLGEGT